MIIHRIRLQQSSIAFVKTRAIEVQKNVTSRTPVKRLDDAIGGTTLLRSGSENSTIPPSCRVGPPNFFEIVLGHVAVLQEVCKMERESNPLAESL
jgi:hypothetical protein